MQVSCVWLGPCCFPAQCILGMGAHPHAQAPGVTQLPVTPSFLLGLPHVEASLGEGGEAKAREGCGDGLMAHWWCGALWSPCARAGLVGPAGGNAEQRTCCLRSLLAVVSWLPPGLPCRAMSQLSLAILGFTGCRPLTPASPQGPWRREALPQLAS